MPNSPRIKRKIAQKEAVRLSGEPSTVESLARYQDALVPEDNIYVSVLSPTLAAALGVDAVPRAVRGAGLAAVLTVDEQVGTGVAACVPRLAVEGAAVHV